MSWTIEFWWQNGTGTGLQYLCGVPVSGDFRIFNGGNAGTNFVLSGNGVTTLIAIGTVPPPGVWVHIAFVFDASVTPPTITAYANGVPSATVAQTGSPALSGGQFIVGGQVGNGLNGGIDDFRMWSVARTASEIATNYNSELSATNQLVATNSGIGIGDLFLSLTAISPGATQDFTLITGATSGSLGSGPAFGITPDAATFQGFLTPLALGNPFHFPVGPPAVYQDVPFTVPPGTLVALSGQTFDLVPSCSMAHPASSVGLWSFA
jgi:hypothetical protein